MRTWYACHFESEDLCLGRGDLYDAPSAYVIFFSVLVSNLKHTLHKLLLDAVGGPTELYAQMSSLPGSSAVGATSSSR